MEFHHHTRGTHKVAELVSPERCIDTASDFLDVVANAGARSVLVHNHHLHDDFFDLKTGLAGEILQKVSNYRTRLGVIGDHSRFTSGAMRDFIRESNRTGQVVFVASVEEALDRFLG